MAHVQLLDFYEPVSRAPSTLNRPTIAVKYTIDGAGPFEARLLKEPGWEAKMEAAVRTDAQARQRILKASFDI